MRWDGVTNRKVSWSGVGGGGVLLPAPVTPAGPRTRLTTPRLLTPDDDLSWLRQPRYSLAAYTVAWTPALLSPFLWLKGGVGTYQNSSFTTPAVADGDPEGGWQDQGLGGRNVTQGTSANKPTLKLAVQNGLAVSRFDGVNDRLTNASATLSQPYTVFVAGRRGAVAANQGFWGAMVPSEAELYYRNATGALAIYAGGAEVVGPALDTNFHLMMAVVNGASSELRLDGGSATTVNPGSSNITTGIQVSVGSEPLNGDIGELVVIPGVISAPNRVLMEVYLRTKWGTP